MRAPSATVLRASVAIAAGGVFALFLGLSLFAFPSADDFCYAAKLAESGFGEAQWHWYATWSGRYASNAAVSAAAAGPDLVGRYPAWAIASLVATLLGFAALAFSAGVGLFRGSSLLLGAVVACVVFITLVPDPAQTFYWMTGSLTYQLGNAATLFHAAALVAMERGRSRGLGARFLMRLTAALAAIVAIGANEVSLVLVMSILFFGTLASFWLRRPTRGSWTALFLIGLVAAAISVAAPGNFARAAGLAHDGMLRLPTAAAFLALFPWAVLRLLYWLSSLAVLASALLLWYATHDRLRGVFFVDGRMDRRWLAVPAAWITVMVSLHAVGFAVNRYPLPERAESVVAIAFVLGVYPALLVAMHALWGDRPAPDPVRAGRAGNRLARHRTAGQPDGVRGLQGRLPRHPLCEGDAHALRCPGGQGRGSYARPALRKHLATPAHPLRHRHRHRPVELSQSLPCRLLRRSLRHAGTGLALAVAFEAWVRSAEAHVLEVDRLRVDAARGRRDPVGEPAGLDDRPISAAHVARSSADGSHSRSCFAQLRVTTRPAGSTLHRASGPILRLKRLVRQPRAAAAPGLLDQPVPASARRRSLARSRRVASRSAH